MLELERILKQDRLLRAMTGLNRKAFDALLLSFTQAYGLFYCKCYPTFDLASVLFQFDRSQAHEWTRMNLSTSALGTRNRGVGS